MGARNQPASVLEDVTTREDEADTQWRSHQEEPTVGMHVGLARWTRTRKKGDMSTLSTLASLW